MKRTLICLLILGVSGNAFALRMTFEDFSSQAGLTLNGSAAVAATDDGNVMRLTSARPSQSGSVFSSSTVSAENFSSFFSFRITDPGGPLFDGNTDEGADGIVFVIQSVSSSIGGLGYGIGYEGILNSVGIEFDTWQNTYLSDPSSNHVGIDLNGNVNHWPGAIYTADVAGRFDDGGIWYSWVDYDGTDLEVRISQTGIRPEDALLSYSLDIISILGAPDAFIGFTSATGADWGNHDILSWEYRDEYEPVGNATPEPETIFLLGSGLVGIAGIARRFDGTTLIG